MRKTRGGGSTNSRNSPLRSTNLKAPYKKQVSAKHWTPPQEHQFQKQNQLGSTNSRNRFVSRIGAP